MASIPAGKVRVIKLNTVPTVEYGEPEENLVQAWVESYREIGQHTINNIKFYVRPITRIEYRACEDLAKKVQDEFENLICTRACLWPENFDFNASGIIAGLQEKICKAVLDLSGFTLESRMRMLEAWREKSYDQEERWDMLIEIAYPYLTTADLDVMPRSEYLHYLAKAEFRIRTQLLTSTNPEFNPDELVDLLLMTRDDLNERLDAAENSIKRIMEEQRQFEAQQGQGRRRR